MKSIALYVLGYVVLTIAVTLWTTYDLLTSNTEYFALMVDLTSGSKLVISLNFLLLLSVALGYGFIRSIFGELRILELEHVIERIPLFLFNNLFNLTVSENDIVLNCFLLGLAVFCKCHHIIMIDRYDFVHIKLLNQVCSDMNASKSGVILAYLNSIYFWVMPATFAFEFFVAYFLAYDSFINLATALLFGFQFFIQGVETFTYFVKVLIQMYETVVYREVADTLNHNELDDLNEVETEEVELVWESKPYYIKTIDILCSVFKSIAHLGFMYLLTVNSGPSSPISMIMGTYTSFAQTYKEVNQFVQFIEASKKLDVMLPTALALDLSLGDNLCSICRDVMSADLAHSTRKKPKKLPCGHMIHMGCLKEWLEMSEDCPLCRRKVFVSEEQRMDEQRRSEARVREQEIQHNLNAAEDHNPDVHNNFGSNTGNSNEAFLQDLDDSGDEFYEGDPEMGPSLGLETSLVPVDISDSRESESTKKQSHKVNLPNALKPDYWSIVPLQRVGASEYKVHMSHKAFGRLQVSPRRVKDEEYVQAVVDENNGSNTLIDKDFEAANNISRILNLELKIDGLLKSNLEMKQEIKKLEAHIELMKQESSKTEENV